MTPRIANPFTLTAPEIAALIKEERPLLPELETYRGSPGALADQPAHAPGAGPDRAAAGGHRAHPADRLHPLPLFHHATATARPTKRPISSSGAPWPPWHCASSWARRTGRTCCRITCGISARRPPGCCRPTSAAIRSTCSRPRPAFALASTLHLLGRTLDGEVRARVRSEIDQRIFQPYLAHSDNLDWYMGGNNWNGVCNSSVASAFLLIGARARPGGPGARHGVARAGSLPGHGLRKGRHLDRGRGLLALRPDEFGRAVRDAARPHRRGDRPARFRAHPAHRRLPGHACSSPVRCSPPFRMPTR